METEILNIISHIKSVSKKRVTDGRIKSEVRKKDMLVEEKDFELALDNLVSRNKLELRGNDSNKMYFITTHRDDTILVPQTQESDNENSVNENTIQLSNETSNLHETSQVSPQMINSQSSYVEENGINDIFKELQSFKDFQSLVDNNLVKMEEAIISNCRCHSQTQRIGDEGDATPRFVTDLLRNRITALESELQKNDTIIGYLTKQLVISFESNSHSKNNLVNNIVITSKNRHTSMSRDFTGHLISGERSGLRDGRKNVFVVGDSMLNDISERRITTQHSVKVRNFPGATTERINEEIDDILQSKPSLIIIHTGTNDLATKTNPLNNLRKILKKCNELSPKTKLAFSNIIVRKDKVNLESGHKDINSRMKSFCQQKGIG